MRQKIEEKDAHQERGDRGGDQTRDGVVEADGRHRHGGEEGIEFGEVRGNGETY